MTLNVTAADGLPLASRAAQETAVAPSPKKLPDAGLHATGGSGSKLSLATGANSTTAPGR